ncbi:54S ribosomal protein L12, mitochondrial [Basidiobolus ranarum]|uniref:54S ribosomal protein L12, mitochondrial n=1 Tax=Basidiobolus ranarum TaxID=34480 RepID=A0ABR2WVC0_9FUNG
MAFALQTRVALRAVTRQALARQAPRTIFSSVLVNRHSFYSTEAAPTPGESKTVSPKISNIVNEISGLTLLETADLVKLLKERLNIQDIAAPVVQVAAAAAPGAAAAEEEKAPEKTMFNVKLDKFDAASKAKIIREIKGIIPGCNLVEAKKFVESAPKVIKENVPKEEAEALKKTLEALGATIVME